MKKLIAGGTCSAAVFAMSMVVFAQATPSPTQSPAAAPAAQEAASASEASLTLVGCVQPEADYRRAKNAGGGGVAGTGAGVANEFVLVNASPKAAGESAAAATPAEAVGTSGAAGEAYELTGSGEGQLQQYVGKRVEIVGKMKDAAGASHAPAVTAGGAASATGSTGAAAGSATGSASGRPAPTGGVDVMGQDLRLKEFEVASVREASGTCPASRQ